MPTHARAPILLGVGLSAAALALTGCAAGGATEMPIGDVAVGACFTPDATGLVALVDDCTAPHRYEATARIPVDADARPDDASLQATADDACPAAFRERLGVDPIASTEYVSAAIVPGAEAWDAGARSIICAVARADGAVATTAVPAAD